MRDDYIAAGLRSRVQYRGRIEASGAKNQTVLWSGSIVPVVKPRADSI